MSRPSAALAFLVAAVLLGGCNIVMRRTLDNTGQNQVVRVEDGQRLYLTLDENVPAGCRWDAVCKDPDVWFEIAHEADENALGENPGKAKVEIRIDRGYDGPSEVRFRYKRPGDAKPRKEFTIFLYRRTGDSAFWKR